MVLSVPSKGTHMGKGRHLQVKACLKGLSSPCAQIMPGFFHLTGGFFHTDGIFRVVLDTATGSGSGLMARRLPDRQLCYALTSGLCLPYIHSTLVPWGMVTTNDVVTPCSSCFGLAIFGTYPHPPTHTLFSDFLQPCQFHLPESATPSTEI